MAPKINSIKILVFALLINGFLGLLLLLDEGPVRVDLNEQHCPEYVCEGWWWSPKPRVKEQTQAPTKIPTELKDVTNHKTSTDLAIFENTPPVDSSPANASLADSPTAVTSVPSKLARGMVVYGWIIELIYLFFVERSDVLAWVGASGVLILAVQYTSRIWEPYTPLYLINLASIVPVLCFLPVEYQRRSKKEKESADKKAIKEEKLREAAAKKASSRAARSPLSGAGSVHSDS